MSVKHGNVTVQLTGEDGNAFAIIGRVAGALRRQVSPDAAEAYTSAAMDCGSYDDLLSLTMGTVHVV
jgi:hypothetical protein